MISRWALSINKVTGAFLWTCTNLCEGRVDPQPASWLRDTGLHYSRQVLWHNSDHLSHGSTLLPGSQISTYICWSTTTINKEIVWCVTQLKTWALLSQKAFLEYTTVRPIVLLVHNYNNKNVIMAGYLTTNKSCFNVDSCFLFVKWYSSEQIFREICTF